MQVRIQGLVLGLILIVSGCLHRVAQSPHSDAIQVSPSPTEIPSPPPSPLEQQLARARSAKTDEVSLGYHIEWAENSRLRYEEITKRPRAYIGRAWTCTGRILEIHETDAGDTVARLGLDDWGTKAVWVVMPGETELVTNDRAFVVGYLAGEYSYISQAGWQITIPALAAIAMLKPGDAARLKSQHRKRIRELYQEQ